MSEIRFYHLQSQNLLQALPPLIAKAYENGHRILVRMPDEQIPALSQALWSHRPESFLPHGSAATKDSDPVQHPIWLAPEHGADEPTNPNQADVLILTYNIEQEISADFKLCCDVFDGRIESDVTAARARWKTYKDKDLSVTYWQQTPQGGWEKKAG